MVGFTGNTITNPKGGSKMKRFITVAGSVFIGAFFFSALISIQTVQAATYNFTYSTFFPPTHIQTKVPEAWAKEIETLSKGQIKIQIFPGGSLTPAPQIYDGVVKGISDFGLSVFAYSPGRFPVVSAVDNPFGYPNAFVATRVINELNRKFQPKELSDVHVCYLYAHGPGLIHSVSKPIRTLEDVKGLKIRSTGTSQLIVRALGATPVAMSQGETYDALKKNIVDGTLVPVEALEGFKQGEVLKYTTLNYSSSYTQGFFVAMNLKKWESLPPDLQKIITDVSKKYEDITAKAWGDSDESGRQFCLKLGHEFIKLSDQESARFKEAVKPVFDEYIKGANAKGIDGEAVFKAAAEMVEKYSKEYK
ncbi:MAG: C4-dicarboxylate ABC transporter substrate-binding protein [Deltaproteobacteria bacterium CG_4_8_14_3_um_filter_51_11]|nr:MAG: C4-dicarboxylate ABC transporter substrate-binding protein [Deltaproteobacteria bacterium CG23_combo_of_CG06-09_8_20_14_all_51_20]PIX18582.1 MAG: C4-dicarboxylate ABC transporter substrate-binding protein [Deltaproteobacteria bacterium CG_4_8_14_3_um_filter_51_11]PIY22048.1 MAG: C4-dicarboxylate ABC transporter substrate-binding protein [Deltaproteobacteria bacterium CG_4_10_14_3_um_filter_51_14]PJB38132.1 MAG: C4-dicarboxylate ABC transporter substrate-binding protein [Deltaproteobacter